MANQMLSVVGSIQPDPFSSHHVITSSPTRSQQDDEAEVLDELGIDGDRSTSPEEEDAFARLGKMADEAKEAEIQAREKVAAAVQKEKSKKKKRKEVAEEKNSELKKEKKLKRKKP
jgi:DNA-directed RNA polymerase I subunit RPA43